MLQQAGLLQLGYGLLKRIEQRSPKFENDCRCAISSVVRHAATSDGKYQSCTGGLVWGSYVCVAPVGDQQMMKQTP